MLHFPERHRHGITIHLTALIDIVFLLIIFFLLTSNFIMEDAIAVKLPDVESIGMPVEKEVVVVIDKAGNFFVDEQRLEAKDLEVHLRTRLNLSVRKNVLIKADREAVFDSVVQVMDMAKKNGAKHLMVATEQR
ncbi:MAG: biopolymer transporter ExbD [Desulfobulbaceae bacterium]|nr:biopolymer transporter ExbD [Desulfobulbaceae bacterium]